MLNGSDAIFAQEHINCGEGQHLETFYEDYPEALI